MLSTTPFLPAGRVLESRILFEGGMDNHRNGVRALGLMPENCQSQTAKEAERWGEVSRGMTRKSRRSNGVRLPDRSGMGVGLVTVYKVFLKTARNDSGKVVEKTAFGCRNEAECSWAAGTS